MDTSRSSLGELAGLAIERELVTYCCIAKDSVGLSVGGLKLNLSPEDARELLRLLLRGVEGQHEEGAVNPAPPVEQTAPAQTKPTEPEPRSEPVRPSIVLRGSDSRGGQDTEAQDTYQKRELFRAPSVLSGQEPTRTPASAPETSGMSGDGGSYPEDAVSEEYLDSVLSFALSMNIIEGYTKDRESHTVTLRTGATTTGLSYWETLEYLTNSMLYELRPRSEQ